MKQVRTKVLYLNHSMAMGGIETMIVDLARLLPNDEFEPHVAVFDGGGSLEAILADRQVPVHSLDKHEGIDPRLALRLRGLLRRQKFQVIHSHNYSAWLYACLASRGLPGLIHVHTEHSRVDSFRRRYFTERWLSRFTTAPVAVSKHVYDVMVNEIGIISRHVQVIHNGVDTARFSPKPEVREKVRRDLGIAPDDVAIGIVARLAPIKNHEVLIRAHARFCDDSGNNVRLLIVGDGTERASLEALVLQVGSSGSVSFLGERRDTPELLNAFDIYALPSFSEGMNFTLLEAMSTGLPVVATRVGGNVEIVDDATTGYLVPSADAVSLHERLRSLAVDPERRLQMGRNGRERTLRLFDQRLMMQRYLQLYRGEA